MKKKYVKPTCEHIVIELKDIIVASGGGGYSITDPRYYGLNHEHQYEACRSNKKYGYPF